MFIFQTHDQALMWSRFQRLFSIMAALLLVAGAEGLGNNPTWLFTSIAIIVGQLLAFKCWADMIVMREPYLNCWSFRG